MIQLAQGMPFRRQYYLVKEDRHPLDLTGGVLTLTYKRYLDSVDIFTVGNGLTILDAAGGYIELIILASQVPAQQGTYTGSWNFVAADGAVYSHQAETLCVIDP